MLEKPLPVAPYDIYVEGLKGIMEIRGLTLEEARSAALADADNSTSDEHLPLIEAAYQYLLSQQDNG